jgi:hypothetical protein
MKNNKNFAVENNSLSLSILNPNYVTGFTDAEGSYHINISMDKKCRAGWHVQLIFTIKLHKKDHPLLKRLQSYLKGVGKIKERTDECFEYRVSSTSDLAIIINNFEKYPLVTQKQADFKLFKQAYELIKRKEHLTIEGIQKIVSIRASMNTGLSEGLKVAFPTSIPVPRPKVEVQEIKDPN